ncbi:hypothetical protein Agub_g15603, partial [Astrephomene gubernaculifera]
MDFTAYISGLSPDKRTLLYRSPWTSLAVFRNLPPLAQLYVMRLLFLPGPFPADYLDSWCRRSCTSAHRAALAALQGLDVLMLQQQQHQHQQQPGGQGQGQQGGQQQKGWTTVAVGGGVGGGTAGGTAGGGSGTGGRVAGVPVWALHADFR